jgi:hypothetical protein
VVAKKNVPQSERFFAKTLIPPSFLRNIIMTSSIEYPGNYLQIGVERISGWLYGSMPVQS